VYEFIVLISTVILTSLICCSARWLGAQILPPLLAGSVVTSIFIAGKLGDLSIPGFGTVAISVSILIYSSTFLITDVISELYGPKLAQSAVLGTALCYPIVLAASQFSIHWTPSVYYPDQQAFANIMSFAGRVTLASLLSYLASQTFDVWAFHKIRSYTGKSKLWIRNNGSTIISQGLDTAIFYGLAFYGLMSFNQLLQLIVVAYLCKVVIALVDTPFVYAVIYFVRKNEDHEQGIHPDYT